MVKCLSFHKFFFFCLQILFNVNGKATVWRTPCYYENYYWATFTICWELCIYGFESPSEVVWLVTKYDTASFQLQEEWCKRSLHKLIQPVSWLLLGFFFLKPKIKIKIKNKNCENIKILSSVLINFSILSNEGFFFFFLAHFCCKKILHLKKEFEVFSI
jgi:hypothetical protein